MPRKKYPTKQTVCVDDCICPYCGHKFDGTNATNGDIDCTHVTCPECDREMAVMMSVEYTCTVMED